MKRKFTWNSRVTAGMIIGLVSPIVMVPLTMMLIAWAQNFYFSLLWSKFFTDLAIMSKFISLSIIPNLVWFYLFLNKERYDLARGIIIGSALFLPFILYVNLLR
ncbi:MULTISPECIES: hypothetical protein [Fluviicola]|jgi:hypothetical protein|uniref:hypothetical protein n=1 Tax=Fluviicola TaxID=332102 RepID=UPI003138034C